MWWYWPFFWDWNAFMRPNPSPDGYVVHLPPSHRQRHVLGETVTIPPAASDTGYEQKEKACRNCGAVRVTVLSSAGGRRGWRRAVGAPLIETSIEPPCPQPSQSAAP
jgi:hypothetical protein